MLFSFNEMLTSFIHSFTVVSTSPVAQGNEMSTALLVYSLAAVAGFSVVMLAILLIAIAAIRYKGRKQQQRIKGIYSCSFATLIE